MKEFSKEVRERKTRGGVLRLAIAAALGAALGIGLGGVPCQAAARQGAPVVHRSRVIDFDDTMVEGMNRRPLDSLNQIGDPVKGRRRPHLYRKRAGFRDETSESLREMRYRG